MTHWLWSLWDRLVPRANVGGLAVSAVASSAPVRAFSTHRADWKTEVIARILSKRTGTFVDVGANVGQTLLDYLAAPQRSKYLGFEPNPVCFLHLSKVIGDNMLEDCVIVPTALGDRTGISQLYRYGGDVDSGATTRAELRPRREGHGTAVSMFRLDDLPSVLPEADVALIKIDVEGSELEALRGMRQTIAAKAPWILCEVLHRDRSADPEAYRTRCRELTDFVDALGYRSIRLRQSADQRSVESAEAIEAFPDLVWDDRTSPLECDYLLVPASELAAAEELFAR